MITATGEKSFTTCNMFGDHISESNMSSKSKKNFHSTVMVGSPYRELNIQVDPSEEEFKRS
jgi:hypothetical protein